MDPVVAKLGGQPPEHLFGYSGPVLLTLPYGLTTCHCKEEGHTTDYTVDVQERRTDYDAHSIRLPLGACC